MAKPASRQARAPEATIHRTARGPAVRCERALPYPPQRVWVMLTEPREVAKWFVPIEIEPRPGGRLVQHHTHVGADMELRVVRFEPPRRFEHTLGEGVTATWEVLPGPAGCRLVLTQAFPPGEGGAAQVAAMAGTAAGWQTCLDVLEDILAGAAPQDSAPPRGTFKDGQFAMQEPGKGRWAGFEELRDAYATSLA